MCLDLSPSRPQFSSMSTRRVAMATAFSLHGSQHSHAFCYHSNTIYVAVATATRNRHRQARVGIVYVPRPALGTLISLFHTMWLYVALRPAHGPARIVTHFQHSSECLRALTTCKFCNKCSTSNVPV